jgi:hypothetical protein
MPSVLIVGFRRSKNINAILEQALRLGAPQIFVALDGPRNLEDKADTDQSLAVATDFQNSYPSRVHIKKSNENLGCAVSVLTACDWVFQSENFIVVIEDDCLPSEDFFKFVMDAKRFLETESSTVLICGTQFAPEVITESSWSLCCYPLIWGWATTRSKWEIIKELLRDQNRNKGRPSSLSLAEFAYWKAGSRRAIQGYVDAWDIPLVFGMRSHGLSAILPSANLVYNAGNDEFATHTFGNAIGVGASTHPYIEIDSTPKPNEDLEKWLRHNFYKISRRHLISTKATRLLDFLGFNRRKRDPLYERWT